MKKLCYIFLLFSLGASLGVEARSSASHDSSSEHSDFHSDEKASWADLYDIAVDAEGLSAIRWDPADRLYGRIDAYRRKLNAYIPERAPIRPGEFKSYLEQLSFKEARQITDAEAASLRRQIEIAREQGLTRLSGIFSEGNTERGLAAEKLRNLDALIMWLSHSENSPGIVPKDLFDSSYLEGEQGRHALQALGPLEEFFKRPASEIVNRLRELSLSDAVHGIQHDVLSRFLASHPFRSSK